MFLIKKPVVFRQINLEYEFFKKKKSKPPPSNNDFIQMLVISFEYTLLYYIIL